MKFMLYFNSTSEIHAILGYILIEFELGLFSGDELLVSFIKKPSRDLQKMLILISGQKYFCTLQT